MTAVEEPAAPGPESPPLLSVRGLGKTFVSRGLSGGSTTVAVDDVSFDITQGEALALVGESGSGKTTVGRMLVRLTNPTSGRVAVDGRDVAELHGADLLQFRRDVQMVFQNTQGAFNPRRRVRQILSDAHRIHRADRQLDDWLANLMGQVGLDPSMLSRYPHQFSGGQRQRIGIARALSVQPRLLVADEPVSALDVSVQAQVLNLFAGLRRDLGLSLLLISHDLRAVYFLCERIAVLYQGRLVELAPREELLSRPAHPYSKALIAAVPTFRPEARGMTRRVLSGEMGAAAPAERGCNFAPRCPLRKQLGDPALCLTDRPVLRQLRPGVSAACHFADETGSSTSELPAGEWSKGVTV